MELSRAQELLKGFAGKKILVVGDVVLDHYVHGDVERINPEAPVPILRVRREHEETGGAGNVAKNLAALGIDTHLISVVGDDGDADILIKTADSEGYKATLIRDSGRPTIRKTRHIVENKMKGQQLLRVDVEETHLVSGSIEDEVITAIESALEDGVDGVIVSDYAKGVVTKKLAERLLDRAGQKDVLVAADVKPSRAQYFTGASFVSPNIKEAHEYVGLNPHEERIEPPELARLVSMKLCTDVYMTMGGDGMYVYCGGECGEHVPQSASAIEPSGAGDTAVSVLLLAQLAGATEVESAELANAACAVVVNKVGSVSLTLSELDDSVNELLVTAGKVNFL